MLGWTEFGSGHFRLQNDHVTVRVLTDKGKVKLERNTGVEVHDLPMSAQEFVNTHGSVDAVQQAL